MTLKRGLAPLCKVKPAAQNLRIKHLVLLLMMKTFIYSLIKTHFRVFYESFFGIFYSFFGIFSIPFMAFIFMSVSECIMNWWIKMISSLFWKKWAKPSSFWRKTIMSYVLRWDQKRLSKISQCITCWFSFKP